VSVAIAKSMPGTVNLNSTPTGVVTLALPAAGGAITGQWLIFGKVVVQLEGPGPIPQTTVQAQITTPGPKELDFSSVIMPPVNSSVSVSLSLQGTLSSPSSVTVVLFCNAGSAAQANFAQLVALSVDTLE
jgi:hypothetical protein